MADRRVAMAGMVVRVAMEGMAVGRVEMVEEVEMAAGLGVMVAEQAVRE